MDPVGRRGLRHPRLISLRGHHLDKDGTSTVVFLGYYVYIVNIIDRAYLTEEEHNGAATRSWTRGTHSESSSSALEKRVR